MATASLLHWTLNVVFRLPTILRNTCVLIAPIFGVGTTVATYLLTKDVTCRASTALVAAVIVAVVPAYTSRSVGGSYEVMSIFALVITFYMWVQAVRVGSMLHAATCALMYGALVAAGISFENMLIINVIPLFVAMMVVAVRYY
ncbi:hypothetical protein DYB37_007227 [Aphanomyces astaci]|uniref:dolichyl-diphosphooligosaccharide--protein glycotransferase n=1 Tax=Aphanomyces astaci TaxID=112090 RepID=A0A3R6YBB8_APHAT|nr:hypothetical protein DYB37_007227 [Aphanomyces astaci]